LCTVYATELEVDNFQYDNGPVDHARADIPGTIANALLKSSDGDTITLTANSPYYLSNKIVIDKLGINFRGNATTHPLQKIVLNSSIIRDTVIFIKKGGSTNLNQLIISNVVIDGNFQANSIIKSCAPNNNPLHPCYKLYGKYIKIDNSTLINAGNHILVMTQNRNIVVSNSILGNAGIAGTSCSVANKTIQCRECQGEIRSNDPSYTQGAAIHVVGSAGVTIFKNYIKNTRTAGINITDTLNSWVIENNIQCVGLNGPGRLNLAPTADGITGYHNDALALIPELSKYYSKEKLERCYRQHDKASCPKQNWYIDKNIISNSGNAGIHVSGHAIFIRYNQISNADNSGINLGDQREKEGLGAEISTDSKIINNTFSCPGQYHRWAKSIDLNHYDSKSVVVSPNSTSTATPCN